MATALADGRRTHVRPLTRVQGQPYTGGDAPRGAVSYVVACRDCGELAPLVHNRPQSLDMANRAQRRHLAEHMVALAAEIQEANR